MEKTYTPTPHNEAKYGDIAKTVLMPGDPLRAKYIAETWLENPVCFNQVRNMLGYTGTYKGKEVSVMGSGMGIPPKFRSLKHKIIQQSLENAGNFLSIFCILCMALYGFV